MSNENNPRLRLMGVFKSPPGVSRDEYIREFRSLIDRIVAVPLAAKHLLKYEMAVSNSNANSALAKMSVPSPEGEVTVIITAEANKHEDMIELMNEPSLVQLAKEVNTPPLAIGTHSFMFLADFETWVDK
ncbi:hypothetical protein MSAN_02058500 [Mycena sanguinolenta]|uniref:EthD domain-containing protein n=1 Tax=Mycena sanguinolenta TaxID=230812 RepID=A0A8H6XJF2_9AGAR|nr:hypothetical protein MSAN_02058500 [Mycena sanguinolenta]